MTSIIPPRKRACERCGRVDTWDENKKAWVAATVDGRTQRGSPHCLHEWDITGSYSPVNGHS